ncbi:MAG: endonuclease/exonuclease/phosphatase family protein [Planctomycetaceae bacterium]|nr:endonuclease/exonuclease/phosphatase family protein [Planctomycetaceae bacterium]
MTRSAPFCLIALLFTSLAPAAEPPTKWKQTATLAAPEAFQAAAADDSHVYAITNDRVARYDRATGQRLGVSTGEAKHLNSGFLWEGKLYCAHSNYPLKPEHSEIKVLDLESLALTTFKDFGNFGGSLTWAVRHDGHWWCNFARYGPDNAQTFLVKLTDDWREASRWTYPPEVIRELGRNSLSGGLWHGDTLIVTGHDDPVLFRLALPEGGNILKLVGKEAVPFTGQGFALVPANDLVGINRGKRQVVVAALEPRPIQLRVLTYNIHHGEGTDGKLDLERIAGVISSSKPDLVALQEVDQRTKRTGQVDQPTELARLTGMEVVFGPNIPLEGGQYGNAVLSRLPILRHKNHALPLVDGGEQRGVLEVELHLAGDSKLILLATHLDHRRPDAQRLASAKAISELIAAQKDTLALLAGDLNDVPDSPVLKEFLTTWASTARAPLPTIPVEKPERQIDYLLARPAGRWKVIEAQVLDESVASDHRGLLVVLQTTPR